MNPLNWSKLPSLTALRAFDAVARTESFSAAARSLNVTPAAIAQQVKSLEEYLDVTLAQRSPQGVSLTPEGEVLAANLRDGFATIAAGVEALQERRAARPVRVTTTSYFAEAVIFPHIAAFWRQHPKTEISFTPSDEALDIVGAGFDLAVRAGSGVWDGLRSEHLLDSPTVACAAPELVDDPDTDWDKIPWLIPDDTLWEREALRQSGIEPGRLETLDVGDTALEIRAAEEGIGLVLESEVDLRQQLLRGSLKPAPIRISHVSSYFLVTPPWTPRPGVQEFIAWLKSMCGDQHSSTGGGHSGKITRPD